MADYYPLIAKAITGLKNDQDRWTLYERGRDALLNWKQSEVKQTVRRGLMPEF